VQNDVPPGLGRAIQVRRAELGLGRRELAESARLSYPYLSEVENGKKAPSAKAMWRLARALELGVAELVERAELTAPADEANDSGEAWGSAHLAPLATLTGPTSSFGARAWAQTSSRRDHRGVSPYDAARAEAELLERIAEVVAVTVRAELSVWTRKELPKLMRREVARILSE